MAVLESYPKHNMVAYLKKTDGNAEFHEIIDFLARSSIHNALTISPVVSTIFIEQFWMSAKSKIINNVRYITSKVAGKHVSISEASIRSDLLFDDADGIDSLPNQAIFDAIQLMGYEGDLTILNFNKALFSPQWRFLFHTMNHCLGSKSTSWDQIPTNIATAVDPSLDITYSLIIPDSILEDSGGNQGDQAKEIQHLKAQIKKLKKKAKPVITHHRAWMKSVSLKQRLAGKKSLKKKWMQKESVSKQGRKSAKAEPIDAQEIGEDKICRCMRERKGRKAKVMYEDALSTDKEKDSTDRPDERDCKKVQEDWEAEEEVKKLAEEEATNAALIQDFDDIKARIEADRLLALRLQEEEREREQAAAIKNRPPTRTQLRSQMMTYLKHVGNKKHSDLKNKTFEEIQALYEKVKRFDKSFNVIGSIEDERKIKELNEGASDPDKKKKFVKEDVLTKVPAKPDVAEKGIKKRKCGHMKMLTRKRKRPQSDVDSDDEHRKCLKIVTFEGTIDSEIMERKSVIARLNKVSSPDGDYLVIYRANGNFRAFNYLMEGDLKIMMESSKEENDQSDFWNNQQNWEIVTWRLYEACGVYILELEDGTVIHMLVERRYPLSKDLMQRMLDFGLEVEIESTVALDLIRFIKQQLNEEVLNSPCFMVKSWLVQDQTVLGFRGGLLGESSTAQETRTDGSPYWIDDDLAKVKGPERGDSAYTISIHSQCFSIVNLYLYKLAITLSRLQRSVQFGTH
ncbi:hypothetical protein Tco_0348469, partial [Tanacetum coccineum]